MFYMVTSSMDCRCGRVPKGKILIAEDGKLYYNGQSATDIGSSNCERHCVKIEIK